MPEVFRQLQDLDEKRIRNVRNYMIQSVQVERNVFPIIEQCLDGIVNAANKINENEVSSYCLIIFITKLIIFNNAVGIS